MQINSIQNYQTNFQAKNIKKVKTLADVRKRNKENREIAVYIKRLEKSMSFRKFLAKNPFVQGLGLCSFTNGGFLLPAILSEKSGSLIEHAKNKI